MKQIIPAGQPLFEWLFALTSRMNAAQLPLRIIGGMALQVLHKQRNSNPRTTADLDCASRTEGWANAADSSEQVRTASRDWRSRVLESPPRPELRSLVECLRVAAGDL